jgi:DNA mismatch repair protein MutL
MPIINTLPDDVINKIAAGEVVERPASVVKELVENSIDAGAASIKVDVLYGGRRLIAVSDDGVGMDREDLFKCVERHATSKITGEEDLENIATMGFRGEALSSIASVSRMKIASSPEGSVEGVVVEIHGGRVVGVKDRALRGTSIEVRDLFYNTPARHKFLKSAQSELYHIIENVTQAALAQPERAFYLKSDEKDLLNLQRASDVTGAVFQRCVMERLVQLYGTEFTAGLFPVSRSYAGIDITGFTSREGRYRKTRAEQYFFVNRRPIKDAALRQAVYRAYGNLLPGGAQPMFFIYIGMDPARVDFNVHPSKREVRFLDKEGIFSLLCACVRDALIPAADAASFAVPAAGVESFAGKPAGAIVDKSVGTADYSSSNRPPSLQSPSEDLSLAHSSADQSPSAQLPSGRTPEADSSSCLSSAHLPSPESSSTDLRSAPPREFQFPRGFPPPLQKPPGHDKSRPDDQDLRVGETVAIPYAPVRSYLYVGDVFVAYADSGGLVLLDHHAAHERVLYERFKDGLGLSVQELLFPVQARFTARHYMILRDNLDALRRMGIAIEEFGPQTFIIRALPLELKGADTVSLLSDVAESLTDTTASSPVADIRDALAMRIACHASVRGGRILGTEQLDRLLSDLDAARDPRHCPHGRPTRIELSLDDLRRMFKRK